VVIAVPAGRFSDPVLLSTGELRVTGNFSTDGVVIPPVPIRFLIIPKTNGASGDGAQGVATWTSGETFTHVVPARDVPAEITLGANARGIGLAVMVKRADKADDPPTFDTFTWCVDVTIVGEDAPESEASS
jgi:hypothetical protein